MNSRFNQVGFSQRVQLDWMNYAADLVAAGNSAIDAEEALQELLNDKLSVGGTSVRGNREKAITIILKIWVRPLACFQPLRNEGLELLQKLPEPERIAVHWGLAMGIYPFWGVVAETTGRLLRLQGTAAAAQVQRRMKEQMGQRETVARAARRVLRSFHDWGVLNEEGTKGIYLPIQPIVLSNHRLLNWLVEAYLYSRPEGREDFKTLLESPRFFPFSIPSDFGSKNIHNPRLQLNRHGLDQDLVTIKPC